MFPGKSLKYGNFSPFLEAGKVLEKWFGPGVDEFCNTFIIVHYFFLDV